MHLRQAAEHSKAVAQAKEESKKTKKEALTSSLEPCLWRGGKPLFLKVPFLVFVFILVARDYLSAADKRPSERKSY